MFLVFMLRCPHSEYFDWQNQTGRAVNYYTYGAAVVQVQVDCLTGNYTVIIYYVRPAQLYISGMLQDIAVIPLAGAH